MGTCSTGRGEKKKNYKFDENLVYQDSSLWSVFGITNWQKITKIMQDSLRRTKKKS